MAKINAGKKLKRIPPATLKAVFSRLEGLYPSHPLDVKQEEPFRVLVATILSSRTKDPTTNAAMSRLWKRAKTPSGILKIDVGELAELIKPVGFYQTKAKQLHKMSRMLIDDFSADVPRTRDELMSLPGVGRKVANLVLNICFDIPAICVDTHVHRICNRFGWLETKEPEETEKVLTQILPEKYWTPINRVLVNHGQQVCHPTSPKCTECTISKFCNRSGVVKSR